MRKLCSPALLSAVGLFYQTRFSSSDGTKSTDLPSVPTRSNAVDRMPQHLRPGRDVSNATRRVQTLELDDDVAHEGGELVASVGSSSLQGVSVREHELLDDAYTYFPLLDLDGRPLDADQPHSEHAQRYVPGRQLIEPGFSRYRVDVQYIGSDFDGWSKSTEKKLWMNGKEVSADQRTAALHATTIKPRAKDALEDALAIALDVPKVRVEAGAIPEVGCSVRRLTCHVDVPDTVELQPRTIMQRATVWLEKKEAPLAILNCQRCLNQQFHARHSGTRRVYVYRILNRIAPPLFEAGMQWHVDRFLDVDRMSRFAARLQGTMDYGCFVDPKMAHTLRKESKRVSPPDETDARTKMSSTVRTIDSLRVVRQDDEVLLWFVGKSFLRHQIRNMVAVLKMVGQGLWSEHELNQAILRGFEPSRAKVGRERPLPAPAHGLTLWEVEYPPQHKDDFVSYVDSGPLSASDEAEVRVVNH